MSAPVSVCMIVKNEVGQIESCLKSIRPHVAEICVVDTGSTDGTLDIVKRYADKYEVYTKCNDDEGRIRSFADARNRSFSLATQPWTMWIDGDDEVQGAESIGVLIETFDTLRDGKPALIMLPYEYSHDEVGNVTCLHYRERISSPRDAFQWKGSVHEVLNPEKQDTIQYQSDTVKIIHRRVASGKVTEPGRNLRILKAHYEEVGESDVRQLYYLGLEYGNAGDVGNALKFHKRYVELSGWDDEKFLSCLKIAEHYQGLGQYEDSIKWAMKLITIREGWAEAYFSLSKSYYFMAQQGGKEERRNWERSVHFAKLGLSMPPTQTILFINPMERRYDVHKYLNLALNKIGDIAGALESANLGLEARPDDDGLRGNARLYEDFLDIQEIESRLASLETSGRLNPEVRSGIVEAIHSNKLMSGSQDPRPVASLSIPNSTKSAGLDIIMFIGPGPEPWNPEIINALGIGGSETAAMEMAKRLVSRGHKIRFYGDCHGLEGTFDGVEYIHHDKFFKHLSCDVFITSRRPYVVDDEFGVKSRATICWVHDVHLGSDLTHARSLRIDKFLTLSQWHYDFFLSQYGFIHPDQVLITRNGIDLSRFDLNVARNPHRAVYSSSPDRGLDVAIRAWPRVRERIPDAELHVYYGFNTWERSTTDQGQMNLIQHLKNQLKAGKKHGIIYHGRVGQDELAKEFLRSGVWAYPTWFSETSCQLAGTLISTSDGMKPIEDVKVGDMVLTHKGRFRRVIELIKKRYKGPLYSVKRRKDFRPVRLTAEHPLWVHRGGEFHWLTPGEICPKTDSLFTPRMEFGTRKSILLSDYVDMPVVDGMICRKHDHSIYKPAVNEVELTEDVMFILGLFAADGHAGWNARRNAPGAITFALHRSEKAYLIERVRHFFGGKVRQTSDNGVVVIAYCAPWTSFLRKAVGVGRSKRIPSFVWECSMELQRAFHDGMFAGDGSTSTTPRGNGRVTEPFRSYTSVSPSLAYGIAQLLSNLGFHPGISYSEDRDAYTLNWSERRVGWHEDVGSGFTTEVESVQCEHYNGLVYNFEVEEDRSYVTDRTAVHNCITAMEAQAAGLHIVTSPIAALNETVGDRGTLIPGDWLSEDYMNRWVDAVVEKMSVGSNDSNERANLQNYAKNHFSWDSLADEWDSMIRKIVEDVEHNVVPPYKGVM